MALIAIVTAALIGGVVGYFMGVCRDVSATMFYTHVLNRGGRAVRSSRELGSAISVIVNIRKQLSASFGSSG